MSGSDLRCTAIADEVLVSISSINDEVTTYLGQGVGMGHRLLAP